MDTARLRGAEGRSGKPSPDHHSFIPSAFRRALEHRDRGCRFPGCGVRHAQGHHIQHWSHGGPTTLSNLVLLCRRHHRAVHEDGYRVGRDPDGLLRFQEPNGSLLPEVPPPVLMLEDAVEAIRRRNDDAGLAINAWTARPYWFGERLDLGWAINALHARANRPRLRGSAALR